MSVESRVDFFRSGFTVAVLKGAAISPVREELIRVVRMSCELFWKRDDKIGSRNRWWHG